MSYTTLFAIGIGGFFGAVSRYLVASQISIWTGADFPFGTLTVNAIGSFCLGFLSRFFIEHLIVEEVVRIGLLVGFLGAFTTFSTFSYETVILIQEGDLAKAFLSIISNVFICITLCFLGFQIAKIL